MQAPEPIDVSLVLRELAAAVESYPVSSGEAAALATFVEQRLHALAGALPARPKVHCARCRRDVASELGRQVFMN